MILEPTSNSVKSASIRLWCGFGFLLTLSLLYLGGIWPSLFTIVAMAALPSPFMFLLGMFWPSYVRCHWVIRYYLIACSVAAVLCWLGELAWRDGI